MKNIIFTVLLMFLLGTIGFANENPLFQSEQPLELILEVDLLSIINDKSEEPEYIQGLLIQQLPDYQINAFEIKVKARGNTRRVTSLCEFPPLKFNFTKSQLANTVFEGNDKLKFVSQCRQEKEFQNYVLEEYLLYKTYNIFTEESYKTRLVNITFKDLESKVPAITMTGFLIEDDKTLGKRIGAKDYEEVVYSQDSCLESAVDRLAMFQFMIGNTDWYINTKHNTDIFELKKDNSLVPVPFDFDFSGVINTIYASPSKQIPITNVRQRYFKGSCRDVGAYDSTIKLFNDKRDEIYSLYESFEYLPKSILNQSLKYFSKFYKIINDPNQMKASFNVACIKSDLNLRARK